MIRKTAVAGAFYPDNPEVLDNMISEYIEQAKAVSNFQNLKGIITPHAGYVYSGPIAATAYKTLAHNIDKGKKYTVFILAPSHFTYIEASLGAYDSYETPLGPVAVNKQICEKIGKDVPYIPEAHEREHSLEVQLPFLKMTLKDFEIVPILLGEPSPEKLAAILNQYFNDPDCLFVVSSDLSHYFPYETANKTDKNTLQIITSLNLEREREIDACGNMGIKTIMRLAQRNGYKISLLDYRNSGDTEGDKSGVVGYGALAIHK